MRKITLTQQIRHSIIIALTIEHSELEIIRFLQVAQLFVITVHKKQKVTDRDYTTVVKCQTPAKYPNTIRTPKFVCKVQGIIDKNHRKSINAIAKQLKVSEHSTKINVHKDLQYKSYIMCRGQFMLAKTKDNCQQSTCSAS